MPIRSVLQDWVAELPLMQQTVLLTAIRGPDGVNKEHPIKELLRWYRRCILVSSMDHRVLDNPSEPGGGSFMAPQTRGLDDVRKACLRDIDSMPLHFWLHLMHAAEILGYKHPDSGINDWWLQTYHQLVNDFHLWPETRAQMDSRLGDTMAGWRGADDRVITMTLNDKTNP